MKKILIYDGECSLCSKFIAFLVYINSNDELYITDFNSHWTHANISPNVRKDTIIYLKEKKYYKSDAVIATISEANKAFYLLKLFYLIPRSIRDNIYSYVSQRRYILNKSSNAICKLPSAKFKEMYLK